jgi:hypothetical protein
LTDAVAVEGEMVTETLADACDARHPSIPRSSSAKNNRGNLVI